MTSQTPADVTVSLGVNEEGGLIIEVQFNDPCEGHPVLHLLFAQGQYSWFNGVLNKTSCFEGQRSTALQSTFAGKSDRT